MTWTSGLDGILESRPDADLVVVRSERSSIGDSGSEGWWCVPESIGTVVEFDSDSAGSFRVGKSLRKRIRRHGFQASVTDSGQEFEHFYEHAYLPYVRSRFGQLARPHSRRDLLYAFHRGELLFVLRGDQRVSASLFSIRDGTVRIHATAPIEGAPDAVAHGALAAARKFVFDRAIAAGCRRADLGSCRPSPFDGVLLHKLQWGARVSDAGQSVDNLYIRWASFSPDIADWLQRMPLIIRDGAGLSALTAINPASTPAETSAHLQRLAIPGLERIIVVCEAETPQEQIEPQNYQICWIRPGEVLPVANV